MQVRSGGSSRLADKGYRLSPFDFAAAFQMLAAMGVKRAVAVVVVYDDILAVAVIFADGVYRAVGKGAHLFTGVCRKVRAVVVLDSF